MKLALDAGNSRIKFGLFDEDKLIKSGSLFNHENIGNVISADKISQITVIISCSVLSDINISGLPDVKYTAINHKSIFPFNINYKTPDTLGIDRIVACVSNYKHNQDYLVIDAGTCITYDYVSAEKGYLGGAISPGLSLRFKSMNNFTDKLPLINTFESEPHFIGNSTESCLKSGVINGLVAEINGFITRFKILSPNLTIYLTGGDAIFLGDELKNDIFVDQYLVLKGLNKLIKLNEN